MKKIFSYINPFKFNLVSINLNLILWVFCPFYVPLFHIFICCVIGFIGIVNKNAADYQAGYHDLSQSKISVGMPQVTFDMSILDQPLPGTETKPPANPIPEFRTPTEPTVKEKPKKVGRFGFFKFALKGIGEE